MASGPNPAEGSRYEDTRINLTWRPGAFAVSHDIYLGGDFDDVNDGTGDTFRCNQAVTFYMAGFPGFAYPDGLVPGTTYYRRIDKVNDVNPDSPRKGLVWSFTTANFLIVNDFEDYDAGENRIWYAWKRRAWIRRAGYQPLYPGNGTGSAVGDEKHSLLHRRNYRSRRR